MDRLEITRTTDAAWHVFLKPTIPFLQGSSFGAFDADQSKLIEAYWSKLIDPSAAEEPRSDTSSNGPELAQNLAETQFLEAIQQQQVRKLWGGGKLKLQKVLDLRKTAEQLAVPRRAHDRKVGDEHAHSMRGTPRKAGPKATAGGGICCLSANKMRVPSQPKPYADYAAKAKERYDWTAEVMANSTTAFSTIDQALAETPYLAAWLCSPLSTGLAGRDVLIRDKLIPLIKDTATLSNEVNQFKYPEELDRLPFRGQTEQVRAEFDQDDGLKRRFEKEVERLTKGDAQGPAGWRAIEALLLTPLISSDAGGTAEKSRRYCNQA